MHVNINRVREVLRDYILNQQMFSCRVPFSAEDIIEDMLKLMCDDYKLDNQSNPK